MNQDAAQVLNKLLKEHNISIQLLEPEVRRMKDGGVLIEQPDLKVSFTKPQYEATPAGKKALKKGKHVSRTQEATAN